MCELSRKLFKYDPEAVHKLFTNALIEFYKILLNNSNPSLEELKFYTSEYRRNGMSY